MKQLDIVIFGGSGDLSLRKLMPALFFLYKEGKIPAGSRILAVARDHSTREEFQRLVLKKLRIFLKDEYCEQTAKGFISFLDYLTLDVLNHDAWGGMRDFFAAKDTLNPMSDREIIYYMAVPPSVFGGICENIKSFNLNPDHSRLVVEKPLGENEKTAEEVNILLSACFAESQIYRIDHYLGKEALQNILTLRFNNRMMGAIWNREHIDHIQITVAETIGVEGRAAYMDQAGILRDMVQNHLIQILSCLAMGTPKDLTADSIRDEKVKVVQALRSMTPETIDEYVVRGQYTAGNNLPGYLEELEALSQNHKYKLEGKGETFAALKVMIDNDFWQGVPFYLRTGKRLKSRYAQIIIQLKPSKLEGDKSPDDNRIVIYLQPDMTISFDLFMKKIMRDDQEITLASHKSDLADGEEKRIPEAYEKLLLAVFKGNQSFFVRHDEIIASWKWIDGIRHSWDEKNLKMEKYTVGSMGPKASDDLLSASGHQWYEG